MLNQVQHDKFCVKKCELLLVPASEQPTQLFITNLPSMKHLFTRWYISSNFTNPQGSQFTVISVDPVDLDAPVIFNIFTPLTNQ